MNKIIKNKKFEILFLILFILIEFILYIRILFIDGKVNTNYFCYFGIVLAFLFSIFGITNKENRFEVIALLLTVLADTFLVLIENQNRLWGMFFFVGVQAFHMLYINQYFDMKSLSGRQIFKFIRIPTSILIVLVAFIVLQEKVDAVSILSVIYFVNFLINLMMAYYCKNKITLFTIGFTLFICCDIFVGMGVLLNSYLLVDTSSTLYLIFNSSFNFVWMFYLPSQCLLAINLYLSRNKNQ